ncbi:MAG TPA: tetratricopeptide repeat protein, partial [Fimbriimonadaceae bacterium]|nr:tetratricopeptide repeat protein [Fimbriimonadaceae bacterium]
MIATLIALSMALGRTQDAPKPMFFDGTGSHTRQVATSSPLAQRWFNQGLAFMFAFNHDEAVRSFQEAARVDPNCAMAYWGIATALGPNINNPTVEPEAATKAYEAIQKADAILKGKSGVERDLVSAQLKRYSKDPSAPRGPLDKAYAQAMRGVWSAHPKDTDIGALTAESLMDLHPWDLWTHEGAPRPWTPEIRQILNDVLKLDNKHPLALHLTIHSTESSAHPEDGLYAAHAIADLEPGMGHMVHMPSHTYVRTGDWDGAITTNEKAIAADEAYFAKRPEQGFYLIYMAHNHQMLAYAAMMVGRSKDRIDGIDALVNMLPMELQEAYAPFLDGYLAAIYEARI